MSQKVSILKNFLYNLAYQVLLVITPLIISPYISRVLGSDGIGVYSYSYTVANYFAMFCMLGVNTYGSRSIAVCRDNKKELNATFSEIYSMQFYISIAVVISYLVYVFFIGGAEHLNISLLQIFFILSFAIDINWLYFGLEEFKITVIRKVIIKVFTIVLIFIFVKEKTDLIKYTFIMSFAYLISEVYLWFFVKGKTNFNLVPIGRALKHIKGIVVLFIPLLAVSIYRMMDKVMLGNMVGMNSVGQYENAEKIIMVCLGVVSALGTIMIPRMSKLKAENDSQTMHKYFSNSMRFVMFFACGVAFGIGAVGQDFAPIFFGEQFIECGKVMQILAISVIFIAWSNVVRTQYLIPCHKDKIYIIAVWSGAIVNLCLNCLLIPIWGAVGAATATIITELIVCVIQTISCRKEIKWSEILKETAPFAICGFIMWMVLTLMKNELSLDRIALLICQIIVGVLLYLVCSSAYIIMSHKSSVKQCIDKMKIIKREG